MYASYESIMGWLRKVEATGAAAVLTVDLAAVLGISKSSLTRLARRGAFGPYERAAGRFYRVSLAGVRAFVERYRCAFMGWVSAADACRQSGTKASTLMLWLNAGVIGGGRDMHGRVHIDPASLSAVREHARWTRLPDKLALQGDTYYSLAHLARALTVRSGISSDDTAFEKAFRRNYTLFYRWLTQTSLSRQVRRVGRRRALYIPWQLYRELVDVVRPAEAAAIAGETPHMLNYWTKRGRIGFVQFGGTQRMIRRDELAAFVAYRTATKARTVKPRGQPRPSALQLSTDSGRSEPASDVAG